MSNAEMNEPGYEKLAEVLSRAYDQAARGKGKERHSHGGEPFHEQVIMDGARRFGVGSLLFQAYKKSEESQRLSPEHGVKELLGAIVYLSAAVIERERLASEPFADATGFNTTMNYGGEVKPLIINRSGLSNEEAEGLISQLRSHPPIPTNPTPI